MKKIEKLFQYAKQKGVIIIRRKYIPNNLTNRIIDIHTGKKRTYNAIFSHKHRVIIATTKNKGTAYFRNIFHELIHYIGREQVHKLYKMVREHLKNVELIAPHPNTLEEFICETVETVCWKKINKKVYNILKKRWENNYKHKKIFPKEFAETIDAMIMERKERVKKEILSIL